MSDETQDKAEKGEVRTSDSVKPSNRLVKPGTTRPTTAPRARGSEGNMVNYGRRRHVDTSRKLNVADGRPPERPQEGPSGQDKASDDTSQTSDTE